MLGWVSRSHSGTPRAGEEGAERVQGQLGKAGGPSLGGPLRGTTGR